MSDFSGHETAYGFKWGPATIERIAEIPQGIVMLLKTDGGKYLQIYVSAKGKSVRIHEGAVEWEAVKVTTFEPCGFIAKRTGALTPTLDSIYEFGVRQPNGRKLTKEQWAEYVEEHFEVVYRQVPDLST